MKIIIANLKLNLKVLLLDKLPFLWSVLFPVIYLFINKESIHGYLVLRYFWSYIILTSYVFGVGVALLSTRESGFLKFAFSLAYTPNKYLIAQVFTQYIYTFVCFVIFNLIATILFGYNFLLLMLYSVWLMLLLSPIAFLSYGLLLIKKTIS